MDDTEELSGSQAQTSAYQPERLASLELSDVEGFPSDAQQKIPEHWSKSVSSEDHARARAILPKLPKIINDAVARSTLKVALRACSDEQAVQWLESACAEVKAKLSQGYYRWLSLAIVGPRISPWATPITWVLFP